MKISHSLLLRSPARIARAGLGAVLLAGIQFTASLELFAQCVDPPLAVSVTLTDGSEVCLASHDGTVATVPLHANQALPVTLQFSSDKVNQLLVIGSYDGGQIDMDDDVVSVPASLSVPFTFQATEGGVYRILVLVGRERHLLRFRVKSS